MADFVDSSITDEIVDAKNKLVAQSNRAQTILDTWEGTESLINDAPIDGSQYARKDGEWTVVNATGSDAEGMEASVYDPNSIEADVYDRSNHTGTQGIETVAGLSDALSVRVTDAPIDDVKYVRKNSAWVALPADGNLTVTDVFSQGDTFFSGGDSIFSLQNAIFDAPRGCFRVYTHKEQGPFPYKGTFNVVIADCPPTQTYDSGSLVTTNVVRIEASLVSEYFEEDESVRGIYYAECYDAGDDATRAISFKKLGELQGNTLTEEQVNKLEAIEAGAQVNKFDYSDAPSDGSQYARKDGTWVEVIEPPETVESITVADVFDEGSTFYKGNDAIFLSQGAIFDAPRGCLGVDAHSSTEQGPFPYRGVYDIVIADSVPTQVYDSGSFVDSNVIRIQATLIKEHYLEDESVRGIYYAECYDTGDSVDDPISFTKIAEMNVATEEASDPVWGSITGTLADQADLQTELDAKLEADDYTASDVKTKYESNADTNVFTDAQVAKLASIEEGAQVNATVTLASTDLTDTPSTLGTSGQVLAVNDAGTALEYVDVSSSGGGDDTVVAPEDSHSIITTTIAGGKAITYVTLTTAHLGKTVQLKFTGDKTGTGEVGITKPSVYGFTGGESLRIYMASNYVKSYFATRDFLVQGATSFTCSDGSGVYHTSFSMRVSGDELFPTVTSANGIFINMVAVNENGWEFSVEHC